MKILRFNQHLPGVSSVAGVAATAADATVDVGEGIFVKSDSACES